MMMPEGNSGIKFFGVLFLCLLNFSCFSQIDTNFILLRAKIHLLEKFNISLSNSSSITNYIKSPLSAIPIHSEGFGRFIIFKIPHQILCIDSVNINQGFLVETPRSSMIDTSGTELFVVGIDSVHGHVIYLAGFENLDFDEFIKRNTNWIYKKRRNIKYYEYLINSTYKIDGFQFYYRRAKIVLIANQR